jgi:hypothetical protein
MNKETTITGKEWDLISHSLGINLYHAKRSERKKDRYLPEEFYRNYYAAPKESKDFTSLLNDGIVDTWEQNDYAYYCVTEKGIRAFREHFTKEVTLTYKKPNKSRETFLDYLAADCGQNFSDFLGIVKPTSKHTDKGWIYSSNKYGGVKGEFKPTKADANKSYKEALKTYKKNLKDG